MTGTLKDKLRGLLQAGASNHDIALGLGVGVAVSFFPVYGPQIPACLLLVVLFRRLNRVAVLLGVQFSWLYPVVVFLDYQAGRWIVPGEQAALRFSDLRAGGFAYLVTWVKEHIPMLLAGSVIAGAAAGALTYVVARGLLSLYRRQ